MTNIERRTIELEFYATTQLIFCIEKNANFLTAMLESLHFLVPFNIEKVILYANKFNWDYMWIPYPGEVVGTLFKYSDLPVNAICKAVNISRPTGYQMAEKYNADPPDIPPKVPIEDIKELHNFIKAYKLLRERMKKIG